MQKQRTVLRIFFASLWAILLITVSRPLPTAAQGSPEAVVYVDRGVLAYDAKRYDQALKEFEEARPGALRLQPLRRNHESGLAFLAPN